VSRAASPQLLPFISGGADPDRFIFERSLWQDGYTRIAGVDEVGRGPLAGPVIAACVILPAEERYQVFDDSKKLSFCRREQLFEQLTTAGVPIGIATVWQDEIDRLNILQASLLAMKRSILQLVEEPDFLLIDGNQPVDVAIPQRSLVKGDSRSASIAAASIVAKVTRDRLMTELDRQYPQYNFKKHKGYPTREHRVAIRENGPCPLHRLSFRGVREFPRRPPEELAKDDSRS
jgi:ribonuclease HII